MTDDEFINRILANKRIRPKPKTFVEKMREDLARFGGLSENQLKVLKSIAAELGITLESPKSENQDTAKDSNQPFFEVTGSCGTCKDGLVFKNIDEKLQPYLFVCNCDTGKKRPEKFPIWREDFCK